jgi:hypothetical protein
MPILLITYDFNEIEKHEEILVFIKSLGAWATLSKTSYAIKTDESPIEIMKKLQPLLDENNKIFIITLASPFEGRGSMNVNFWLKAFLSEANTD